MEIQKHRRVSGVKKSAPSRAGKQRLHRGSDGTKRKEAISIK
jgi:hypothetical protein